MEVTLLHATPLVIASTAIRKCWNSQDKSDTYELRLQEDQEAILEDNYGFRSAATGSADLAVIHRVGNQFNHKSTLRHCHLTFDCSGVSTKTLLALTRYTVGKEISVESTRYTYEKRMKNEEAFCTLGASILVTEEQKVRASKWLTLTGKPEVDVVLIAQLELSRGLVAKGYKNDYTSMTLSQAYNYSFIVTFNIESLQWFLHQREAKAAHWDIQAFAKGLREAIPEDYKYLFKED